MRAAWGYRYWLVNGIDLYFEDEKLVRWKMSSRYYGESDAMKMLDDMAQKSRTGEMFRDLEHHNMGHTHHHGQGHEHPSSAA